MFDVNHFHTYNDRYGKARGDELLKKIANNARSYLNEVGGIVCRSVADTFMMYCIHTDNYEEVLARLSACLGKRIPYQSVRPETDRQAPEYH